MFYAVFRCVVLIPLLRWLFRPRIEGLVNVPARGAAIVAGNHQSFCDQFLLGVTLRRRINFLAKQEYFTGKGLRGRLAAAFFRGIGAIPVDRSGNGAGQAAVEAGLDVLDRGGLLGIFPEGTRSHDGRLYKGRVGVAAMALRSGAPVIPCAMIGTFEAQPAGRRVPSVVPITLRFGRPLDFSKYAGMEDQRAALRAATDEIMYAILELSGQEYVDTYAVEAKAAAQAQELARRTRRRAGQPPADAPTHG
ncbi:lysophospholipid acyltransferase family protein [Streptomyces sp. AN091965]|uniref:lysophospholipid acyltransferase family protein n=1 Tax=Streptomyces sp. AN091965 TaxID=2927803 RepID=UPI001F6230FD|nr:lysophospholipid acyltransferase family protein [Streptomyces sp. AN091965]MCI3934854.1 1-acyl-sn-glycerol-3-phosphate acyltransferase [Streptomyces sp. AN091965]